MCVYRPRPPHTLPSFWLSLFLTSSRAAATCYPSDLGVGATALCSSGGDNDRKTHFKSDTSDGVDGGNLDYLDRKCRLSVHSSTHRHTIARPSAGCDFVRASSYQRSGNR